MKILEVNDLKYKDIILDLIVEIPKLDWSREQLSTWLVLNLGTDVFNSWLAIDEQDKPVGVLTCEVIDQNIEPKVYISACYVKQGFDYASNLLCECESWTKDKKIKKVICTTKRKYRGFERKFGFKLERVILSKEL